MDLQERPALGCRADPPRASHEPSHGRRSAPAIGYSLQANRKTIEGTRHPDRNAQFEYINARVQAYLRQGQPAISVDTKKKELVGDFKNAGQEWRPQRATGAGAGPRLPGSGAGTRHSLRGLRSGRQHGLGQCRHRPRHGGVCRREHSPLVAGDGAPSVSPRPAAADHGRWRRQQRPPLRLWKVELQNLADDLRRPISVCHFPPGTSKWNKIEHRLFSFISQNWRGQPLVSHAVIVNLIAATTTPTGLHVERGWTPTAIPRASRSVATPWLPSGSSLLRFMATGTTQSFPPPRQSDRIWSTYFVAGP